MGGHRGRLSSGRACPLESSRNLKVEHTSPASTIFGSSATGYECRPIGFLEWEMDTMNNLLSELSALLNCYSEEN